MKLMEEFLNVLECLELKMTKEEIRTEIKLLEWQLQTYNKENFSARQKRLEELKRELWR